MTYVHRQAHPKLNDPIVLAAFGGWNDAGDAATSAIRYLATKWNAREFATIDSEDFYDFSISRPFVRLHDGVSREIEWPVNTFSAAHAMGQAGQDMVLLIGVEPQLKWRTFCSTILDYARELGASRILTLGSLLADVPHTRPSPVSGVASSSVVFESLGVPAAQYEGPTGITGTLQQAATRARFGAASLWVAVPHYIGQTPSPKATLRLVQQVTQVLRTPVDTTDLERAAAMYDQQVNDMIEGDDDLNGYVLQLEEAEDSQDTGAEQLAAEAEQFLRDQGS